MAAETRVDQLQKENTNTRGQLMIANDEKAALQKEYDTMQQEYALAQKNMTIRSSESKMTISDQERRLSNLQELIDSQTEISNRLRSSITNALMNYKADELTVYLKDGNVHVSLSENLLFKSGSAVVDLKGKQALKSLADVLNTSEDFTVVIEGHTDNVPIKTQDFSDNWSLSTARANSIVRILTNDYGFDPQRIISSGKSQFHPIANNETTEGKAANRRTEIILSPDLQEIHKLLYE